jgi:hypothetical protein
MQLIQANAKSAPRTVITRYGQKTVIDAVGHDGQEITIWRGGDDRSPALASIGNGSRISVGLDSKGKYSLLETPADRIPAPKEISPSIEPQPARPMGFVSLPMEAETKLRQQLKADESSSRSGEIADYIERLGKLYGHCYQAASKQLESTPLATPEVKDVATTLFIQTVRHFSL